MLLVRSVLSLLAVLAVAALAPFARAIGRARAGDHRFDGNGP
jgi:hypothetical protein